jgi:hypothetical protein
VDSRQENADNCEAGEVLKARPRRPFFSTLYALSNHACRYEGFVAGRSQIYSRLTAQHGPISRQSLLFGVIRKLTTRSVLFPDRSPVVSYSDSTSALVAENTITGMLICVR